MPTLQIIIRDIVYILCFILSMQAMQALNYEKLLKKGHVRQAQVSVSYTHLTLPTIQRV